VEYAKKQSVGSQIANSMRYFLQKFKQSQLKTSSLQASEGSLEQMPLRDIIVRYEN